MKTDTPASALQTRAAKALKVLLGQVSGVKVKEMTHSWLAPAGPREFLCAWMCLVTATHWPAK